MTLHPLAARRFLWTGAALSATVSLLFLAKIIPLAGTDPRAASEWPIGAFWVCLGFNGLAAAILCFFASSIVSVNRRVAIVFGLLMVLALLFAFALSDAAFAFLSHGPILHTAAILLHLCSATDFLVASLVVIAVVSLPRNR